MRFEGKYPQLISPWTKLMLFHRQHFQMLFLNKHLLIWINMSLKFIANGPISNIPTLVLKMAWCWKQISTKHVEMISAAVNLEIYWSLTNRMGGIWMAPFKFSTCWRYWCIFWKEINALCVDFWLAMNNCVMDILDQAFFFKHKAGDFIVINVRGAHYLAMSFMASSGKVFALLLIYYIWNVEVFQVLLWNMRR